MLYSAPEGGPAVNCTKCSKSDDKVRLTKCPICHKEVCDDCRHHVSGRYFCSSQCARFFFFQGDEDEHEE